MSKDRRYLRAWEKCLQPTKQSKDQSPECSEHLSVAGTKFMCLCFKRKANIQHIRVWSKERSLTEKAQLAQIRVPYGFCKSILREPRI